MANNIIYTTQVCPYCQAAKRLLQDKGIAFEEITLDDKLDLRMELSEKFNGWRTVPMIVLNGKFIGGYTELTTHFKKNATGS